MNKSLVKLSTVGLVIAILLGACQAPAPAAQPPAAPPTSAAPAAAPAKQITIGYLASELDIFTTSMMDSVTQAAQAKGWKVIQQKAGSDAEKQTENVDYLISLGVNAIVVNPVDSKAFCVGANKAKAAGIGVYAVDRTVDGCKINMTAQSDNYQGGVLAGEAIAKYLKNKTGGEPKGNVLENQGDMGLNNAQARSKGFHDVVDKYPGIKVTSKSTEWKPEKYYQNTLDVAGSQQIDAIFSSSDSVGTTGILQALDQLGKKFPNTDPKHIFYVAIDASPIGLKAIRDGFQDEAYNQPNTDFGVITNFMEMELQGKKIPLGTYTVQGATWSPAQIEESDVGLMMLMKMNVVTKANVDDKSLWGNH
jgi:ABC-type sugar transport system substrate-binding protein